MMAKDLEMEVANFVCKFTDSINLVDLLDEVVLPAFFSGDTREYWESEFFFMGPDFRLLEKGVPESAALCCRFVKNCVLKRHQYYSETQGLIADEKSLESAPSAVVALILKSHRLLYVREVPSAPTAQQFGKTFLHFMKSKVAAFRDAVMNERVARGEKVTKKEMRLKIPFPSVDVVPVVSSSSAREFIERFKTLNNLRIEVAPTNNELDLQPLIERLREAKDAVKSTKTIIQHHSPQGLNKKACLQQVEEAKQGNSLVQLRGTDKQGDELVGNNENFSVKAGLGLQAGSVDTTAKRAYAKFCELEQNGVIEIGSPQSNVMKKISDSYKRHKEGGNV